VLSIHKLVAGQARYYLDQAERRVDVVQSIGDGVEEYYAGGVEARGEWMGVSARELGLTGSVDGEHLRAVLEGRDRDSAPLRNSAGAIRVAGYDLTMSAPTSVSVLFGLGDPTLQQAVREAHGLAVSEAFRHIEASPRRCGAVTAAPELSRRTG
jgi:conjugative relaxase-like TrwC/TraI family protein